MKNTEILICELYGPLEAFQKAGKITDKVMVKIFKEFVEIYKRKILMDKINNKGKGEQHGNHKIRT